MTMQTSVLVVGAGLVGLSAALELGRRRVPCVVVERRAGVGDRSRVTVVGASTMELFRSWGIDHEIRRAALPFDNTGPVVWKHTLAGETFGRIGPDPSGPDTQASPGIEGGGAVFCASDAVESVLLAAIRRCPSVDVRFSTELGGAESGGDGVTAQLVRDGGEPAVVRSDFLLACDGLGGGARKMLGIACDQRRLGVDVATIAFEADLRGWTGERPCVAYWIVNSASSGCLVPRQGGRRWLYTVFRRADDGTLSAQWCTRVVREAVGVPELTVRIADVRPQRPAINLACRSGDRRVFLAGAHRFLPMVGPGMNLGIHDAYDFAWKVAALREGRGEPTLLNTYEDERKTAAQHAFDTTVEYVHLMAKTGISADVYDFAMALEEEGEDAAALRDMVRSATQRLQAHWDA